MSFYKNIAAYYNHIFPLKKSRVSFIESWLPPDAHILDIGCASGALCLELANLGHHAAGIDADADMIALAQREEVTKNKTLQFYVSDMSCVDELFPENSFHAVLCLGNTLAHLDSPRMMGEVILRWSRLIRKNGVLIIQTVNYETIRRGILPTPPDLENGDITFRRRYLFNGDSQRLRFVSTLTNNQTGESEEEEILHYPLTQNELAGLLQRNGFQQVHWFGEFTKMPFNPSSPALIAVAIK